MKTSIKFSGSIFIIFLVMMTLSCKKKDSTYTPDCSGGTKSFATDVQPIMQNYCSGCHSSYGTYSGIVSNSANIRSAIANGSMPKNGSLSDDQKNKVLCWIDNGALNN